VAQDTIPCIERKSHWGGAALAGQASRRADTNQGERVQAGQTALAVDLHIQSFTRGVLTRTTNCEPDLQAST
jgi:hypothetical protein